MALRIAAPPLRGRHWALTTTALRLLPVGNKNKTEQPMCVGGGCSLLTGCAAVSSIYSLTE